MTIKIKAKEIGINKPIEIKPTISKQDKANAIFIKLLSMNLEDEKAKAKNEDLSDAEQEKQDLQDVVNSLQEERDFTAEAFTFLKDELSLTDKQVTKAMDTLDFEGLGEYLTYVIGRIKGRSEADFELDKQVESAKDSDSKKE